MTKNLIVLVMVSLGVVTPCFSESTNFSTEKASPLKLATPRHGRVAHFAGRVRQNTVLVVQLHPKHRVGQQLQYGAAELDHILFRHAWPWSIPIPS